MKERLKHLRKELNLTQSEFAGKIGATQVSVAGWESGARNITESRILQICQTFGVRRAWLETGEGEIFDRNERISLEDRRAIQRQFVLDMWETLKPEQQEIVLGVLADLGYSVGESKSKEAASSKTAIVGDNNSDVRINQ